MLLLLAGTVCAAALALHGQVPPPPAPPAPGTRPAPPAPTTPAAQPTQPAQRPPLSAPSPGPRPVTQLREARPLPGATNAAAPQLPANVAAALAAQSGGAAAQEPFYEPQGLSRLQGMKLEQFLYEIYAPAVQRTLLRPQSLPDVSFTLELKTKLTRREFIQMCDHLLALNGVSTVPVGEKFITVVAEAQAAQQAPPFNTREAEDLPEAAQYITQVVQLKNVLPSKIQPILAPFAKNANAIVPFEESGVLVIRDYAINVKRMLEIVQKVDVASSFDLVEEVIPVKYALAGDIASVLGQLAGSGAVGQSASTRPQGIAGTPSAFSVNRAGGNASGSLSGLGQQGGIGTGLGGVGGGGVGGIGQQQTGLGGTRTDFQNRLNSLVRRATDGGDFQLLGEVKIIPDERTNSLLVFATKGDLDKIKSIIAKLDVVLAQVLIEAIIMDVNLGDGFNLAFSYGQRPQQLNNGQIGGTINNSGQLNSGAAFLNQVLTNGASYLNSGDGLAYFGSIGDQWDVAVSAAANDSNFKVLARPRVQTSHAEPARIFVGETRPYVSGTFFNGGLGGQGSSSQYQQTQIGLTLEVLPLVNQEGLVVMDIQQQVQQVADFVVIDGNEVPVTQDESSIAKVSVKDRETIVLGGFIRDAKRESNAGVPLLKDIPGIGYLFRSTSSSNERRELLVLIRPTVLPTPEAASLKAQEIRTEMPSVNAVEQEITEREQRMLKKSPPPKKK
jgi:general secretion pathway protein D